MNIAVFGTGVVGQVISEKLLELGHQVTIGTRNVQDAINRSEPGRLGRPGFGNWHQAHPAIKIGTYAHAAASASIIVMGTSGDGVLPALDQAGHQNLSGKILLDITNPLDFSQGMPPSLFVCNTDSLGEQIQRAYPELKVVKSLNTMAAFVMVNPSLIPGNHNVFMSSNHDDAKSTIKALLTSFGWQEHNIVDLGDLTTARGAEQLVVIWLRLWGTLKTPIFNFNIVLGKTE
jgi:predicted dinucleotide-binding enzyme